MCWLLEANTRDHWKIARVRTKWFTLLIRSASWNLNLSTSSTTNARTTTTESFLLSKSSWKTRRLATRKYTKLKFLKSRLGNFSFYRVFTFVKLRVILCNWLNPNRIPRFSTRVSWNLMGPIWFQYLLLIVGLWSTYLGTTMKSTSTLCIQ